MNWLRLFLAVLAGATTWLAASPAAAAQCPTKDCDPARLGRRTLRAGRVDHQPLNIDGRLDDPAWAAAAIATDFVESSPRPAAPASLRSEARVLADGQALYIGLRYFDPRPAGILAPLARRDDETTSDWAFVEIDSRFDRRTAFSFGVNPRGVQVDGVFVNDSDYDASWNGIWQSAAHVDEDGWTAEFRIPFSQLAFNLPTGVRDLNWGINFYRYSPAHGESSNWSPRYRGLGGVVSNFNDLSVPAPARVSRSEATPYVAPRLGRDRPDAGNVSARVGADLRTGLGSSFTATATVLPDFGQVEADPSQVNLTGFELFQPERRPFFLEGLDVFRFDTGLTFATRDLSFASESPFYSRRVGRGPAAPPAGGVDWMPAASDVLGAAKVTGQTSAGWALGVFTAVTDREYAVAAGDGVTSSIAIAPYAMSTVGRATRSFGDRDASFGLLVTDVHRFGLDGDLSSTYLRDEAAVGVDFHQRFSGRRYEVGAWTLVSRLAGGPAAIARTAEGPVHYLQRPDRGRAREGSAGSSLIGTSGQARLSRVNGAFRWDLIGHAVSPRFDMNGIGFQRTADWALVAGTWRYERFRPGDRIRGWAIGSDNVGSGWSWRGEPRARVANGYLSIDTRNYWTARLTAVHEWSALSTDQLRGGPALLMPPRHSIAASIATDQRNANVAALDVRVMREPGSGTASFELSPLLNVRSSPNVSWAVGPTFQRQTIGWQPVPRGGSSDRPDYLVARVAQRTLSVVIRSDVTFSPRLVLQGYVQPFGTIGRYDRWQRLVAPRDPVAARRFESIAAPNVDEDHARRLNADIVLRWEYRPGSYLTVVWNQQRDGSARGGPSSLAQAFSALSGDPSVNIVLLKWSWRIAG